MYENMTHWETDGKGETEVCRLSCCVDGSERSNERIYQNLSPESRCRWHQECLLLFQTLQRQRISEKHTTCVTFVSHQVHPQLTSYRNHSCICHRRHLKFTRRSSLLRNCIVYTMSLSIDLHVYLYLKKVLLYTHTEVCVVVSNGSLAPVRSATMKAGTNQSARIDTMLEVHGGKDCDTN